MTDDAFDRGFYDSLPATLDETWSRLARGAADRRSGFHTAQLATIGADGAPRVRTLVLRGVERGTRLLRLHTDRRSTKAAEIVAEPRVELHLYDAKAKIQLRVRGAATLHADDAAADAAWGATGAGSRVCYRGPSPGAPLDAPQEGDPPETARNPVDPEWGRNAFATIHVSAARLEWLYLAARGHRRAVFSWSGDGWEGRWLAP